MTKKQEREIREFLMEWVMRFGSDFATREAVYFADDSWSPNHDLSFMQDDLKHFFEMRYMSSRGDGWCVRITEAGLAFIRGDKT